MAQWIKLNFRDPPWAASIGTGCLQQPIRGYVPELTTASRKRPAFTLTVSNGSMNIAPAFGLFFKPFLCNSATRLSGPVKLTFGLASPRRFSQLHVRLGGSVGGTGERVQVAVGSQRPVKVPEAAGRPGVIDYTRNVQLRPGQSTFTVLSTAAEMNLVELWWVYEGSGLVVLPFP